MAAKLVLLALLWWKKTNTIGNKMSSSILLQKISKHIVSLLQSTQFLNLQCSCYAGVSNFFFSIKLEIWSRDPRWHQSSLLLPLMLLMMQRRSLDGNRYAIMPISTEKSITAESQTRTCVTLKKIHFLVKISKKVSTYCTGPMDCQKIWWGQANVHPSDWNRVS